MAYGEVYGLIGVDARPPHRFGGSRLADVIAQSAKSVQLHMDVSHDVGWWPISNQAMPRRRGAAKIIGSVLSLGRLQAQAQGKTEQAALLDLGECAAEGGDFGWRQGFHMNSWKDAPQMYRRAKNRSTKAMVGA